MKRLSSAVLLTIMMFVVFSCSSAEDVPTQTAEATATATAANVAETPGEAPDISGCSIFPADNIWNTPVDTLPVDPNSDAYIATMGAGKTFHPDFGSDMWEGTPIGVPYNVVDSSQAAMVDVNFTWDDESDPGPYPIPADVAIEGGADSDEDRHVLIIDSSSCTLYEMYNAFPLDDGSWEADAGAVFDLSSNELRPDEWTSADAAGLPVFPGLVRYGEVAGGEINHAIRFTTPHTREAYVWPARHKASDIDDWDYPPMGQRFRLKAGFDISGFSPDVQVILTAMKKYGIILADNGSPWFFSGVPDERWSTGIVDEFRNVSGSDFEAVDVSSLIVDENSGQAK